MEWNVWTILIAIVLIILIALAIYGTIIWFRGRHTRERFSFIALSTIASLTFALFASIAANLMPWYLVAAIVEVGFSEEFRLPPPDPRWIDHAFLVLAYIVGVRGIVQLHGQWPGPKSVEQHKREQRSESTGLIGEGLDELRRIVKREPAPERYSEPDWRQFVSQLRPVSDSLAWQDLARELLRLSSSSYAFDSTSGWHDRAGCWVGTNVDTGDLVCLYPAWSVSDAEVDGFVRYVERMAAKQKKEQVELIIAGKEEVPTLATSWRGWPIRVETEATLLDKLVNFWDYQNEIRKRVEVAHLPNSNLTLNEVHVHSRFYPPHAQQASQDVERYLLEWLDEPGQRQLALLGEYGQGKSTTALMLTYHLLAEPQPKRIPILIELRGKSPRSLTPLEMFGGWGGRQYRIDGEALMRLLIAGRLLLIFEGFDEMALVGDAQMRLKHFNTLWQFSYPQAKILITGRANFFLDDEEMMAALGIGKRFGDDRPYCEAIRLAPFDLSQIRESLRAHKPLVREQICELAEKHPHFRDVVSRPSLLHMVSVLWEQEGLAQKVDKLNSAYVMDLFIRESYLRQGVKEASSRDFMALTTLEREYFMMGVASYMAAKQLPNQIGGPELNLLIEGLIESMPETVSTASPAISGESRTPLRDRLEDSEDRVEQVKTDVRAYGLLVDDPAVRGTFRFGHQSFMEYLFAATVAEQIQKERTGKARAIFKVTNAKVEDIFKWPISLDFLTELISNGYKEQQYDIYLDEKSRRPTDNKSIVTRLFKNICDETMPFWLFPRFSAFNDAFLRSAKANGIIWPVMYLICPLSLVELSGVLTLAYIWREHEPLEFGMAFILFVLLMPFVILNFMLMANIYRTRDVRFGTKNRLKMRLWNHLCKQIGIADQILHRVVGTWLLPWAKDRPFDFFLPQSDSNGQQSDNDDGS